jgi:predicted dehydrogenase
MPEKNYDLRAAAAASIPTPALDYAPPMPKRYRPALGLIGCGGITEHHLRAYRDAGWRVAAFQSRTRASAEKRRDEFYPEARVCDSAAELLADPSIEVVDIATHADVRGPLIEQALAAGKHVLSQKPFVTDLAEGARLVALARAAGLKLAVNQNGRWAPYFAWLRRAVRAGHVGEVGSINLSLQWDHTWTAGTPFEKIRHLVLQDFGIHWFDAAYSFFGDRPARSVFAAVAPAPGQPVAPPLLASSIVTFDHGLATLSFDACSRHGPRESCTIVGSKGTLRAEGPICAAHSVGLVTAEGVARAELSGSWFPDGFRGAMGELLCAIEDDREPENSAADNLKSLALCLAASRSADEGRPVLI